MRRTWHNTPTVAHIYLEQRSPDEDPRLRNFLDDGPGGVAAGECAPPMDVTETAAGIEVVLDLPGVSAGALRVVFSQGTLIVAGRKRPGACAHRGAAFHLAERAFGRFVRAVRLNGAYDTTRAAATLASGELRIVLPRIEERRGRDIEIRVTAQ